jgi:signal peptidase I
MGSQGKTAIKVILDFVEFLVIGLAVLFFVYVFAGQPLRVTGDSMYPNYFDGEQIIAEKISVRTGDIQRGEIIIFKHPEEPSKLLIKRTIALPGETIMIAEGNIYINGTKLNEKYLTHNLRTEQGKRFNEGVEYEIPEGFYVFMGDNRANSTDSRDWGPISRDSVIGKAFLVYYPLDNIKLIRAGD